MKYKLSFFVISALCVCAEGFSQSKQNKLSEKITTNSDVVVTLNSSHTSVVFETWNRNSVGVEAYIEGDLSDEDAKRILESWQVNVIGNENEVMISSTAGNFWSRNNRAVSSAELDKNIQELRKLSPMISDMLGPLMENIARNPMPSTLSQNQANVSYDTNRSNNGNDEKYIQQWESQIREKFKDDVDNGKLEWVKRLDENAINGKPIQMEIRLETWGEQYGKQMNAWATQLTRDIESQNRGGANITVYQYNYNSSAPSNVVNKTIKVNVPKGVRLRINARHGDVKLAERAIDVRASLSHTKLSANVIDGNQTFIKSSYSPVSIREWNSGRLVVNYVKNCRIQKAKNLLVNADSSNIFIQNLEENGAISGSFGAINIMSLGESFSTLDLAVEKCDFKLNLPRTAFNLSYSGAQSIISLPKTLEINTRKNFGNVFVNGFQKTRSTNKMITINAKYSKIVLNDE
ncbi:hypothetical protein ABW636_15915 [Aquimarina sp. 2201CG1-2-11]|uniref:hypothetical protein n=1 Tax=Aquimarina discodermiae TaxID=3231043 RepID=UPI003461B078